MRTWTWLLLCVAGCDVHEPPPPDTLDTDASDTDVVAQPPTCAPSPRPMRHWTSWQYERVISDLAGTPVSFAGAFPPASGWEGLATSQSISLTQVEAWSDAAHTAATALFGRPATVRRFEVEDLAPAGGAPYALPSDEGADWWTFEGQDGPAWSFNIPLVVATPGTYRVLARVVSLVGSLYDSHPQVRMSSRRDTGDWQPFDATFDQVEIVAATVELAAPSDMLSIDLQTRSGTIFAAVAVDWVTVEGPLDAPQHADPDARLRWVTCDPLTGMAPHACAEDVLRAFLPRAWRREVSDEEVQRLAHLVDLALEEDLTFDDGLQLAIRAALLSPSFLFHSDDVSGLASGEARQATPWELAARVALLLWGTVPDDALAACADAGTLSATAPSADPCGLSAQVSRMLAHPHASAFEEDFGGQWLGLDAMDDHTTDEAWVGTLTPSQRDAMRTESQSLLAWARQTQRPLTDLVTTQARFAPDALTPLVGDGQGRPGLLGHASTLVLTSLPDRTSPVRRGQWVLDRLMCDPQDAPPEGTPALDEEHATGSSLRDLLAEHRTNPSCNGCHSKLDPLGLALEGFDALGRARTTYPDGTAIRTDGALPDGRSFLGLEGLADLLGDDPEVARCLVSHVATWSLAMPREDLPTCLLDTAMAAGDTYDALLTSLATSPWITEVTPGEEAP